MVAKTLSASIRSTPGQFVFSSWPIRATAYVLLSVLLAPIGIMAASTVVLVPVWGIVLAGIERRAVVLTGRPAIERERAAYASARMRDRARARLARPVTWRESGFVLAHLGISAVAFGLLSLVVTLFFTGALVPLLLVSNLITGASAELGSPPVSALSWALPLTLASPVAGSYIAAGIALGLSGVSTRMLTPRPEALQRQVTQLVRANALIKDQFNARLRDLERQLHDGPQIRISTAALHLRLLEHELKRLPDNTDARSACLAILNTVRAENEKSLDALRESTHGLRPRVLQEQGIIAAITESSQSLPLLINISGPEGDRFPDGIEYSVLQMVKEAITNVVKHAEAGRIDIVLEHTNDVLTLTVKDNGHGGANPFAGTGIIGMQERAQLLGGTFVLSSPRGGPTLIATSIPLPVDQNGAGQ